MSQLILHLSCPGASALPNTVSAALTPIAKRAGDCLTDFAFILTSLSLKAWGRPCFFRLGGPGRTIGWPWPSSSRRADTWSLALRHVGPLRRHPLVRPLAGIEVESPPERRKVIGEEDR